MSASDLFLRECTPEELEQRQEAIRDRAKNLARDALATRDGLYAAYQEHYRSEVDSQGFGHVVQIYCAMLIAKAMPE